MLEKDEKEFRKKFKVHILLFLQIFKKLLKIAFAAIHVHALKSLITHY